MRARLGTAIAGAQPMLGTAIAGAAGWSLAADAKPRLSITGTYELAAAVHTGAHPAKQIALEELGMAEARRKGLPVAVQAASRPSNLATDGRHVGKLQYMSDGRMCTDLEVFQANGRVDRTNYSGRWWTHAAQAGGRPPHGDCQLVEHQVLSASDPALVGQQIFQQFELSEDGERLTTIDMRIVRGQVRTMERLEWRRTTTQPEHQSIFSTDLDFVHG